MDICGLGIFMISKDAWPYTKYLEECMDADDGHDDDDDEEEEYVPPGVILG